MTAAFGAEGRAVPPGAGRAAVSLLTVAVTGGTAVSAHGPFAGYKW